MAADSQPGERITINDPRVSGSFVFVTLENEDVIRGTIVRVQDGILVLQHEVLGDIEVQTTRIVAVRRGAVKGEAPAKPPVRKPSPTDPLVTVTSPDDPANIEALEAVAEAEEAEPAAEWSSRIEIGLNGSEGNTERLNSQLAFRTTRVTEGTRLSFDANWRVNTSRGDRTANRLTLNARNDWDLPESKWTLFLQGGAEFDEFRDFDTRVSGGAGFNYRFIESDDTRLSARIGAGFSRDVGGGEEMFVPELITGFNLTHQLTDRQKIIASGELFPDLEETGEYRSVVSGRWEYRLDTDTDLSLAIGVEHRYDTQTTNDMRTDVDFFMRIVLGF